MTTPHGDVLAPDAPLAERAARELDLAVAFVLERLPGVDPPTGLAVEVVEAPWRERPHRLTVGQAWEGHRIRVLDGPSLEAALVHEVVHLALAASDWRGLPLALQEGLAQHLELLRDPARAGTRRLYTALVLADHLGGLPLTLRLGDGLAEVQLSVGSALAAGPTWPLDEALATVDGRAWSELTGVQREVAREIGAALVQRIVARRGLAALLAACREALDRDRSVVDRAWLLGAAGLEESDAGWRVVSASCVDDRALESLATELVPGDPAILAELVEALRRSGLAPAGATAETVLERVPMELIVPGPGRSRRLNDLPEFQRALIAAW